MFSTLVFKTKAYNAILLDLIFLLFKICLISWIQVHNVYKINYITSSVCEKSNTSKKTLENFKMFAKINFN